MSDVTPQANPEEPVVIEPVASEPEAPVEVAPESVSETEADDSDIEGEASFTEDAPDNTDDQAGGVL